MTARRSPAQRARSVEEKHAAQESAARCATFWATRDMWCGKVSNKVRVWLREPKFTAYYFESMLEGEARPRGRCVTWVAAFDDGPAADASALYCEWTLDDCRKFLGTTPDDERQAIRKEGPAGVAAGPLVCARAGAP